MTPERPSSRPADVVSLPPGDSSRDWARAWRRATARGGPAARRWGLLLGALTALGGNGCGTDARGVRECRELEARRCALADACGLVSATLCVRFAREDCLHGLLSELPPPGVVSECAGALERAERCVRQGGGEATPSGCTEELDVQRGVRLVCDLVAVPERLVACTAFGTPAAEPPEADPAEPDDAGAP